ncbi:hypothetical protein Hanom_Chr09g00850361 [Helianthus anomalus]
MLLMVNLTFGVNEDVIDEDNDKFIQVRFTNAIHEIHECSRCICEPKRHH